MQQPDTHQLRLVHLSAEPVLMRIYLHPGMRDYFMQAGKPKKTSALIRKILGDYFFSHASPEQDSRDLFAPSAVSTEGGRP